MGIKPTTVIYFFCLFFWVSFAQSETVILKQSYHGRTDDRNYFSSSNILGLVPAGTEVAILSEKKLKSGAISSKILLKNMPQKYRGELESGDIVYIYQRKNTKVSPIPKRKKNKSEAGLSCSGFNCEKNDETVLGQQNGVSTSQKILGDLEQHANQVKDVVSPSSSNYDDIIQKYENSPQVEKAVKWASVSIGRLKGGGKCYRGTKLILAKGKLIDNSRYSDKYARDAATTLSTMGFVNLLSQPYNLKLTPDTAPKGAVLVYESAVACDKSTRNIMGKGCGHIEVKLGDGKKTKGYRFASDYKSENSILDGATGNKYRLIGVMIKPEL